jgi:hypothetical protein
MKRRILLALCAATMLVAADKPDLSGTWNIQLDKSDFGMMPPPSKMERKIAHKDPEIGVSTFQASERGERTTETKYTTDGKEAEVQLMGRPAKVTAKWQGSSLVVTTKLEFQGNEIVQVETWSLSSDGKTLTSEGTMNSPMGENKTKLIFTRGK